MNRSLLRFFVPLFLIAVHSHAWSEVLLPAGAEWKYLDKGPLPQADWKTPEFDDAGWSSGRASLGYGDDDVVTKVEFGGDDKNKRITTYFRRQFDVAKPAEFKSVKLRLLRDDGAVVYLNGREIWRSNLPEGAPIKPETRALAAVGNEDEKRFYERAISPTKLVAGRNVIAVELHQNAPTSTDLKFDLELTASTEALLSRGPYLQSGTATGMIVRWRTDAPVSTRFRYGLSPDKMDRLIDAPAETTEHVVEIKDLAASTKYFYQVGWSKKWFEPKVELSFVTAPVVGTQKPTRIWVLGDSGTANDNARAVRDAYTKFTGKRATDLWLMLGDNAYGSGFDHEYQAAVFDMYPAMLAQSVLWPALGNHETYNRLPELPYFQMFSLPTDGRAGGVASGTELYYSFDYANIHFVVLDSMISSRAPGSPMLTWLARDLESTTQDWIVVYFHHPPYTKGTHNSDAEIELIEMRQNALPIMEKHGVDLCLTGHSHTYERSFLIDGHYGNSMTFSEMNKKDGGDGRANGKGVYKKPLKTVANQGAVYVVAGSSGQAGPGSLDHPAMFVSLSMLGSVVMDIDGNKMNFVFINEKGEEKDSFSIHKSSQDRADN